jgi:hypothetical protein
MTYNSKSAAILKDGIRRMKMRQAMHELTFSDRALAEYVCSWYEQKYPSYVFMSAKLKRQRKWRIACYCAATNAFLQFQKD